MLDSPVVVFARIAARYLHPSERGAPRARSADHRPREASFSFTKLLVDSGSVGPLREIIMDPGEAMSSKSLVMLKFLDRPASRDQEAILGFITEDLDALAECVLAHGGKHVSATRSMPDHGVRVLCTMDPENRLGENVELLRTPQ